MLVYNNREISILDWRLKMKLGECATKSNLCKGVWAGKIFEARKSSYYAKNSIQLTGLEYLMTINELAGCQMERSVCIVGI